MRMTGASKSLEGDQRGEGGVVIFLHGVRRATFSLFEKNLIVLKKWPVSSGWRQRGGMGRIGWSDTGLCKAASPNCRRGTCRTLWQPSLSILVSLTVFFSATQGFLGGFDGYKEKLNHSWNISGGIFSHIFCSRFNMYDSYTSNVAELKSSAGEFQIRDKDQ